jgi:hypothetical protein
MCGRPQKVGEKWRRAKLKNGKKFGVGEMDKACAWVRISPGDKFKWKCHIKWSNLLEEMCYVSMEESWTHRRRQRSLEVLQSQLV